jgi:hypothetical protein
MNCSFCDASDRPVVSSKWGAICRGCAEDCADALRLYDLEREAGEAYGDWLEENAVNVESRLRAA